MADFALRWSNNYQLPAPLKDVKFLLLYRSPGSSAMKKKVTQSGQIILSIINGQMMRHIRIFLIFVANTDRNENNYCRIRVSF